MCLVTTRHILNAKMGSQGEKKQVVLLHCLQLGPLADLTSSDLQSVGTFLISTRL
jgi:hypothetical protein